MDICSRNKADIGTCVLDDQISVIFNQDSMDDCLEFRFDTGFEIDDSDFVFMPACCYNGNRFSMRKMPETMTVPNNLDYPEGTPYDTEMVMRELPGLNMDNSGTIEVTAGDVSVPCIGVFSDRLSRGVLLFTVQQIDDVNTGLVFSEGHMAVRYPFFREKLSFIDRRMVPSVDRLHDFHRGDEIVLPYKLMEFDCSSLEEFFAVFFRNRKCMNLDCDLKPHIPFDVQKEIQIRKFNEKNWNPELGFYGLRPLGQKGRFGQLWHPAWCGGVITAYALMLIGGDLEKARALSSLDFLFSTQTEAGFFHDIIIDGGKHLDYQWADGVDNGWSLTRMTGDILYYMARVFDICPEAFDRYGSRLRRTCDGVLSLWDRYHDFGQFIDKYTGELALAHSTGGALVPAGLMLLYEYYHDDEYIRVAEESALFMYEEYGRKGITCGGPGDALQTIDSESCAELFMSMMVLYEKTGDMKWLDRAAAMCNLLSTWVMPYNYRFREDTSFFRWDMRTVGTCFANLQNKHSAPAIATNSPYYIYRLYEETHDELYLDLFRETCLTTSQYMSTKDRPLTGRCGGGRTMVQPEGYMDEKVNMSDWSGEDSIGEINASSCWCEVSNMLFLGECSRYLS